MSADDSTRAGRREVGEALVAALGFEPTANVQSVSTDRGLEESELEFNRVAARTVSLDERPVEDRPPEAPVSSNGSMSRSSGASVPGPGTRPNGRRGPRGGRGNGSSASAQRPINQGAVNDVRPKGNGPSAVLDGAALDGAAPVVTGSGSAPLDPGRSTERLAPGEVAATSVTEVVQAAVNEAGRHPVDRPFSPPGPLAIPPATLRAQSTPVDNAVDNSGVESHDGAPVPAEWSGHGHIIPDGETVTAPTVSPMAATSAGAQPPPITTGGVPIPGAAAGAPRILARSGFNGGHTRAVASDLAARVPQLVEAGFRRPSKVRARKVRRVVRHIDPWSVLTFSVLFHLCIFSSFLLASVLVWNAADAAGVITNIESFIRALGDYQTFEINGHAVFRAAMIIAGVLTLASSVLMVLLTVVFNLISDLVGGIRVTVVEEETVRVRRNRNQ